jgi:hypothetical protein
MRISFNRPFRVLITALLATIILIAVTSAIVTLFYEKAVIRYMKKYLDEHLMTQISMDDIRFRALKGFPNATVEINQVVVLSGENFHPRDFDGSYADTLLKARKVSFQFDLIMLFHKDYELKKIEITQGSMNILFDKRGFHNLQIWKEDKPSANAPYSLNLKGITVSDMHFRWTDLNSRLKMTTYARKTGFRGSFANNILAGDARGIFSGSTLLVRDKLWMNKADLEIQLKMIASHDRFRIREGDLKLNKAEIIFQGEYKSGRDKQIDLSLSVPKFGLGEFISLLPLRRDSIFDQYRFTGNGSLKATLKGPVINPDHLQIRSDFDLRGCTARNLRTRTVIDQIDASGNVSGTNASNFRLILDHFNSTLGKGNVSGKMQISSLHDLKLIASITSSIDLEALQRFIGLKSVENIEGMVMAHFDAEGKLGMIRSDSLPYWLDFLKKGTFDFQDAGINLRNSDLTLQHITGKALLNDHITLENLKVRINDNDLQLDGTVQNLNRYLRGKGVLKSDLTVGVQDFSLNKFLHYQPGSPSGRKREPISLFPERMYLSARIHTGTFEAGKFRAEDVATSLTLIGDSMFIPSFSLKFPNGTISGNALISQIRNHRLSITCNSEPRHIDIRQLFTSFNNFTQNFIIDKNVNGTLNGNISFFAQWDSTLRFLPKSLKAKGDLEISDGELVQFEPMMKLSKYINVDELRLIRFKTLKNSIFIENRLVTIPEMAIHSSAFNISVSGQQTFDNVFEYRLNVLLSEVLFNKARKKKKEMDEFRVEENREDQTTIPLILAGTPNNFDVKFDSKRAFSLTRKKMEQTGSKIPDAGNFSIDWEESSKEPAAIAEPPSVNKQDDFKIEWDDDNNTDKNDL